MADASGGDASTDALPGWLPGARRVDSPNFDQRPDGTVIDLLVIHNISLPPGEFGGPWVEQLFCGRLDGGAHPYFAAIADNPVSAHLFIRRDGEAMQFVDLGKRAWHAGRSCWQGRAECNDYAIGVELEGTDHLPFSDAQYARLAVLTADIMRRFPAITGERIVGHSDVAPGRKTDPGPAFDWSRYRRLLAELGAGAGRA
ncbi:MAG: 1,6-anhydro-N-acetylmuramyl-L-alanine amidase AmpD [Thiohalocapsa sp.]|uniref:1,6-anhydro-N-acetylmuramyl-L-alanine amidase AmpD n=1 Tax=Thiohalocapsa sp. TaxID=2497641 RepID=UPI0025CFEECA|nr:1,6-anhydro-N-acetylmuramyl-L-alanine amidase AmpD [Thiohalocapsa sp.]MCG6943023.1 1,6-anhydro-N-acetylmuramyl-L-alanine amidase AmpD [Thiohalocapsa sp.]